MLPPDGVSSHGGLPRAGSSRVYPQEPQHQAAVEEDRAYSFPLAVGVGSSHTTSSLEQPLLGGSGSETPDTRQPLAACTNESSVSSRGSVRERLLACRKWIFGREAGADSEFARLRFPERSGWVLQNSFGGLPSRVNSSSLPSRVFGEGSQDRREGRLPSLSVLGSIPQRPRKFGVVEISGGSCHRRDVQTPELLRMVHLHNKKGELLDTRVGALKLRDLRQVVSSSGDGRPSIEVRRNCILVNMPTIRCIILYQRILLLPPNKPFPRVGASAVGGPSNALITNSRVSRTARSFQLSEAATGDDDGSSAAEEAGDQQYDMLVSKLVHLSELKRSGPAEFAALEALLVHASLCVSGSPPVSTLAIFLSDAFSARLFAPCEHMLDAFVACDSLIADLTPLKDAADCVLHYFHEQPSSTRRLRQVSELKRRLCSTKERACGVQRAIRELLNEEEDLSRLELSRFWGCDELWDAPPKTANAEDAEILLECYEQEVEAIYQVIVRTEDALDDALQLMELHLASTRNAFLKTEIALDILSVFFGFVAAVAGLFGMNIRNGLEDKEGLDANVGDSAPDIFGSPSHFHDPPDTLLLLHGASSRWLRNYCETHQKPAINVGLTACSKKGPSKALPLQHSSCDPPGKKLEKTWEGGLGSSRVGNDGPASPDASDAMLKLLRDRTASVTTPTYSVHIQTRETQALSAYLKGEDKKEGSLEGAEVAFVQQAVEIDNGKTAGITNGEELGEGRRGNKQKVSDDGASIDSYTTSAAQMYLNELCEFKSKSEGMKYTAARSSSSVLQMYCFLNDEIDIYSKAKVCIDSCGKPLMCHGALTTEVQDNLVNDPAFAQTRILDFDSTKVLAEFCHNSQSQKELDSMCEGNQKAARWDGQNWQCYDRKSLFSADQEARTCVDNCGNLAVCYGQSTGGKGLALASAVCGVLHRIGCLEASYLLLTWLVRWQLLHCHALWESAQHATSEWNPEGESYIWCFTTDPTMRFDTCEPLGVTQQYIQPESTFSVEYYSSGASPYKSLRFFEGATEMSLCGSSDLTLSLGVELPADPRGAFVEIPESLFEDGDSQKLVWSGFKLSFGQTGSLLACICDFEFAGAYTIHPNGSCTDVSDYNVHGGLLRIGGPIPSEGLAPLSYTASKPFSLEVSGLQLRKGDRVDIARDTGSSSCFLRSLGRTLSVARGFGGQISTSYQLAAAWLEQAFNMEATVTFKSIETKGPYDLASTEPITVSSIDEYVICWTGEETDGHAVGRIGKFNTTGFDASTRHVATYAPSSSGANTTLFSLYVRYAGSQLNYDSVFFTLREASASRCEGVELAQSSQVSSFTSSKNSEVVRGSGLLLRPTAVGKLTTGTPLHLCINNRKETVFAGFAIVEEFGLFETWQVSGEGTPQGVPLSTHEVILEPFSPLGLHWLQSDTTGFISGAEDFYTAGEFTKTISFAVFEDGVVIYSWTYEDVAPVHVATIKRSGWRALTMDITFDRCILYAAEGGKRPAINKFDASDPRKLASVSPLATSSVSLQSPCCLVTVYEDEEKQSNPSVVFLDKGLGMFVWLNPSLGLVESRDNWSGLRRPLQYPCSLACIPRGTVTSSHSSDEPESKQRGVYDCFIADRDADRVVQIELDAVKQGTVLVREFASVGTAGDRLSRPLNVVAFNYNGETLLFVVQEGRQSIDLLVPKNDGTTDYYSTMEEQSVGQGIPSLPAVVEVGEKGSGLDFARMVLYRTSLTSVAMQTLSLDATAVAQPFTYGHADWYTVGDEDILEPIMAGRTSVGAFKSFNLNPNVSNFAYVSTIADVAETKGTLTLRIAPFTDSTLEISVIGKGVVNEVTSTFSINIACKNGHFMKQGMCAKCPVGTYNSLLLVKQSPTERWGSCKPCSNLTSTVSEGSTSKEQCICAKGYYLDETQPDKGCTPCPPGTWKDIVSDTGCVGIECPSNSSSSVTGAKSSEDRSNAGYVYDKDLDSCILSTAGRYSPGGYKATGFPCPYNTTTMPDPSSPLTSLQDCFCTAGYEPADSAKLADSSTVEYDFREWLRSNPEYSGIADSQPCPMGYYCPGGHSAETEEDQPQVACPPQMTTTSLCDRGFAFRGYDEDGNKTCEPCPSGSYKSSVYDSNCNGLCGSHSTSFPGMQQQDQCFCESGTYYAEGGCHACPVGAVCLGGLTKEAQERVLADATTAVVSTADHIKPFPTAGYFLHMINEQLESPDDWFFIKCPVVSACLENGECSETMDNYLCSECKEGFTSTFEPGEVCTKCPSMGLNIALCTGYYVGLLLFNIGMAYMNVAAGFNRRSIHSIVIKIASNFLTCMSVISMVDFELIELPNWFYQVQTNMLAQISSSEKTHWVAVDCFLREGLQLSYSDSFFFTMLFYALLPIVLPIIATLIMFLIVDRAKHYYRHSTQRKLGVLQQTIRFDMMALAEQLRDKLEEDRLFMMFRYVPLPGESMWRRIYKFFEDMTPIYVTVLFFIYTSTTRRMLSLLECTSINFGDVHGSVSFLTAVMNVQCTVHPSKEYFTFFLLGITGLVFWSIGVPLGAFLVLYVNRKNLNSRENRLKYGFLHNGFVSKYWYWETVVFARKLCVLIVSSVVLVSNSSASAATITVSTAIAIAFNVLHLRCQPFDKRSYLTLDRLENHSMAVWTIASCTMSLMLGAEFQGMVNVVLLAIAILPVLSFALEVAVSLILAYFDNVDQSIQLVAAKRVGRLSRLFRVRNKSINFEERSYFLKVMAEALGLAVVHLRLDVIPGSFLEFALRLGLAFSKIEEDNQNTKASLQALAGGDLSKLLDWTQQEEAKKEQRRGIARTKSVTAVRMHDYYSELEKKLDANEHEKSSLSSSEEEEKRERNRDLEGGESQSEESESESDNGDTERRLLNERLLELGKLVSRMTEEEQAETTYLFDENLLNCGIVLSELYLSLLKLQLKSPQAIASQFEAFRDKKGIVTEERASQLRMKNRKLKIFRDSATCVLNNPPEDIKEILPTPEEAESVKQQLEAITKKNRFLTQQLESLRSSPGDFQAGTDEYLQWIDAAERQEGDTFEEIQRIDKLLEQKSTEEAYGFQEGGILASSGSDLSDKDDSIEKPPKKLLGQPVKVVAANAEDWMEG
ncbi:kringle domain-containing protein [Cyclospora cayetanensis]|uniref:Kringle domain-containing protein n=1 Tax=Cyclospora cayetanensis TaxID=88456 RepID=A0A1D3CVX1_9EIME|nr:kringle domain-containing protein [Cyclospora cayetanensis]